MAESYAPSASRDGFDTRADLADEHREIRELLGKLSGVTESLRLIPILEQLESLLEGHFQREEMHGGACQAADAGAADSASAFADLRREHFLIGCAVKGLLARARLTGEENMPGLIRELALLADCLRHHEDKELALAGKPPGRDGEPA